MWNGMRRDPHLANYSPRVAPLANRVEGVVTGDFIRHQNAAGESALGDLVADAAWRRPVRPTRAER